MSIKYVDENGNIKDLSNLGGGNELTNYINQLIDNKIVSGHLRDVQITPSISGDSTYNWNTIFYVAVRTDCNICVTHVDGAMKSNDKNSAGRIGAPSDSLFYPWGVLFTIKLDKNHTSPNFTDFQIYIPDSYITTYRIYIRSGNPNGWNYWKYHDFNLIAAKTTE